MYLPILCMLLTLSSCFSLRLRMQVGTHINPAIIGGGPTGLSTAIMLAKRGYKDIKVFERLPEYPRSDDEATWQKLRSYVIGVNGRGQNVLRWLGVMDRFDKLAVTVLGRKDWTPTSLEEPKETLTVIGKDKSYYTKCIARDQLAAILYDEIKEKYSDAISVQFEVECKNVVWENENQANEISHVILCGKEKDEFTISSRLLIGADGARSRVRDIMAKRAENGFKVNTYKDNNKRVYKTIKLNIKNDKFLNFSARTKADINLDALPVAKDEYLGVVLFRPWDKNVVNISDAEGARKFFDEIFPMFSKNVKDEDLVDFVKKKPSNFPVFSYTSPVLHKGKSTCIIGDGIHTVKPYFGQGVNSCFEDVFILDKALEKAKGRVGDALEIYSKTRAADSKALVEISKSLDGGFLLFVLPLIADGVFNKICPQLFGVNTISMLQNENMSFSQVQRKKRLDRILQTISAGSIIYFSYRIVSSVLKACLKLKKGLIL